jgi:hypothetical protein
MTSSLRNSLHRRNHKERSQLGHRTKLGLLEKHKDYVKRARDYHSKRDRLTRLRQKAADRNKDEFYFSMVREKTRVRGFGVSTAFLEYSLFKREVCISKIEEILRSQSTLSKSSKLKTRTMSG